MLPEELSADICSLKEGEDRAALACHLKIGEGRRRSRAGASPARGSGSRQTSPMRMRRRRSTRRARNGSKSPRRPARCRRSKAACRSELVEKALKPLWACWRALFAARQKREPLELDLPERRVVLDEKGRILSVAPRERLDAHRLVEDYMIAANVAAARALEAKKAPVMYRVHEPPSREKLVALKDYLEDLRRRVRARPGDQARRPSTASSSGSATPTAGAQRSWSSAAHPDAGALRARAARPFRAGAGDLRPFHLADPPLCRPARPPRAGRAPTSSARAGCRRARTSGSRQIGEQISMLERRAMEAERETIDRYVAAYLVRPASGSWSNAGSPACSRSASSPRSRISAATGWCSRSDLGREYFRYDEAARTLVGDESGETYRSASG